MYRTTLLLFLLLCSVVHVLAQQHSRTIRQNSQQRPTASFLFDRIARSVFVVENIDAGGNVTALGSGVCVGPGRVVTNHHVVQGAVRLRLRQADQVWDARIVFSDVDHDLVELVASGIHAPPVAIDESTTLAVGDRVYAVGAPEGLELSLSEGIVSGLRRYARARLIQTTAPISHGSSGGGLFDSSGNLVGITTFAIKDGQNLNFALPGEWIKDLETHQFTSAQEQSEKEASEAVLLAQAARTALEGGEYSKALGLFQQLSAISPNDPDVWASIGLLYSDLQQQYQKAIELCRRAISLDPQAQSGWSCLGDAYSGLGQDADVEQALTKAVAIDPTSTSDWLGLGLAYQHEGKKADVWRVYYKLKELDENLAGTFYKKTIGAEE